MLRVGTASADITPPVGVELCGYGFYLRRAATGVLDRLMTRALYAESDSGRALFIGNDLIGVDAELTRRTRALCRKHLGVPEEALMLVGTHTHSGPATIPIYGCGESDPQYYEHLPYVWLDVARRAMAETRPARLRLARGPIDPVGYDRHDDSGPVDRELRIACFEVGERPVALLVNHSAHGVMFGRENTRISADWPGVLQRCLETALPGAAAIFVQGSCGTINCRPACLNFEEGARQIEATGQRVAEAALEILRAATRLGEDAMVSATSSIVPLPLEVQSVGSLTSLRDEHQCRIADPALDASARNAARMYAGSYQHLLDAYADGDVAMTWPAEIQILRLGSLRIVGVPGELFMALGQRVLDAGSEDALVMIAGYANEFLGYLPTREAYGDPRYVYPTQVVPAMRGIFPFQAGACEMLIENAIGLLQTTG